MAGIDRFAGSGASLEQLGELEEIRVGVAPPEFELPVGVILAAGTGSRLGVGSKALARLAGITLLERAVITLRAVGIEEILVVVGHEKERLREFVRERGLGVQLVENGDFGLGNGSSACVGARAAGGRFLLAMVDHVVDPEALRRLLRSEAAFALAVDSRPQLNDVDEATKVRLQEGRVLAVRRELDVWEAVDAGLALCDAEVTDVAERSLAAGEQSWNAVKRRWLGEGGEIEAVDLEGLFWIDVDTPADRRRAERTLVSLAARKPLDGPVSRLVNRRLSWPISLVLLRAGVSPGAATVATFLFALAAAAVLALGVAWPVALVLGGLLVQLASILDGVDGEIARASLRSSPFGGFLDSVLDRAADAAVLAALAVAAGLDATTWALLAAALFGSLMTPYVKAAYEAAYRRPLPRPISPINAGRDVRLLVASLSAVALQPFWGLVALAILTNAEAVQRFVGAARTRWTDASAIPVRAESE